MISTLKLLLWVLAAVGLALSVVIARHIVLKFYDSLHPSWNAWNVYRIRRDNDRQRRRQRVRLRFAGFGRQLSKAFLYTVGVLAVAALAPLLFVVFDKALRSWMDASYSAVTAAMLIALVAGFTTALFVSALRGDRIKLAERVLDGLGATVTTDYGVDANLVPFEPEHPLRHSATVSPHHNIALGSQLADEWMVGLHQLAHPNSGRYTIESLREQIEELERRQAAIKAKLETDLCPASRPAPALKWVCFISNNGRFHAQQDYQVFRHQICDRKNANYLTLLNQTDENAFWAEIKKNMDLSRPQATPGVAVLHPDAIPGLDCFWVEKGTSREGALRLLIANNKVRAMLVRDQREGTPLGVVSLKKLMEPVLFKPLTDLALAEVPVPPAAYGEPPGLARSATPP